MRVLFRRISPSVKHDSYVWLRSKLHVTQGRHRLGARRFGNNIWWWWWWWTNEL